MSEMPFRRHLLTRLLRAANAGSLGACLTGVACAACGTNVAVAAAGAGAGGAPARTSASTNQATTTSTTATGAAGHGGAPTTASTGLATTGSGLGGGAGAPQDGGGGAPPDGGSCGPVQACFPMVDGGACPTPQSLIGMDAYATGCPNTPGQCPQIQQVLSGPYSDGGTDCCYLVEGIPIPCYVGRTFFLDEGVIKAELRRGPGWHRGPRPATAGLLAATRRALGEAWARDGLFEHASVASFSRFSLQLLALGAPADLVRDTHAACVDEVRHAELCFALACGYLGHDVEPSALPMPASLEIDADLASVAAEAALEGCVGETVAAIQAHESWLRATDPAVREVLAITVEDETRHAELAWRFLAWALEGGGPAVREAVVRAFAGFRPAPPTPEDLRGVDLALFQAHGRIPALEARAIADRALSSIVAPCVCALLARPDALPLAA